MLAANCKKFVCIARVQLKLTLLPNAAFALLLVLLLPFIFGLNNLDAPSASVVLEGFLSLAGILLVSALFLPEQSPSIAEVVEAKPTNPILVLCTRLLLAIVLLFLLIAGFVLLLVVLDGDINAQQFIMGTFITALVLGALGFAAFGITNNWVAAYLLPLLYYILNFVSGAKRLQNFYLFSLSRGNFTPKYYLLCTAVALFVFTFAFRQLRSKIR